MFATDACDGFRIVAAVLANDQVRELSKIHKRMPGHRKVWGLVFREDLGLRPGVLGIKLGSMAIWGLRCNLYVACRAGI